MPEKESREKRGNIPCPICGMMFEKLDQLIRHLREESTKDEKHEVLLTAYYSISVHINRVIGRLFGEFHQKIREIEREAKNLKRPSEREVDNIISKIEEAISIIPQPADPIECAVYESVIMSIRAILQWRHKTKGDLLRIISSILSLLTEGRKTYISMLMKAAMILSEKYFVEM